MRHAVKSVFAPVLCVAIVTTRAPARARGYSADAHGMRRYAVTPTDARASYGVLALVSLCFASTRSHIRAHLSGLIKFCANVRMLHCFEGGGMWARAGIRMPGC